ncbi:MAG: Uma2 family endonuclease [Mycobacteriales bacterium]
MGTMTAANTATALPFGQPLTISDLAEMPDDGHRYELLDGVLIVSPAPSWPHQEAQGSLLVQLRQACTPQFRVLGAPFAVWPADDKTELQPDVLVARYDDLTHAGLPTAPVLAVEILSPSTALIDLNLKKAAYERFGAQSYWVIHPLTPALFVYERGDNGEYHQRAHVIGDEPFHATQPFAITIVPNKLIAGLNPTS